MNLVINKNSLVIGILVWWVSIVFLWWQQFNYLNILNISGFLFLSLVPGMLTLLNIRITKLLFVGKLIIALAFSLLELMLIGLFSNSFYKLIGQTSPLNGLNIILTLSIFILLLLFYTWNNIGNADYNFSFKKIFPTKFDIFFSLTPILFVVQSILGAIILNNGGSGNLTLIMLGEVGLYMIFLMRFCEKIDENTNLFGLYFVALSLLLMTSLRGWFITGHDIQIEYKVFELTKNAGFWSMDFYRDPYNACLSITILPTIFFNILKIKDPYIYKFLFQIFFAFTPPLVYLISRNWCNKSISLFSSIFFLSFPTFFYDMPFLVRQEIAFIFYGLMIWIIFNNKIELKVRRSLFIVMGIGVVLSHYSTTYTVLMVFALASISMYLFLYIRNRYNFSVFTNLVFADNKEGNVQNITIWMVGLLFAVNFIWTSVVTDTSGNLPKVLRDTIVAARNGFTENNRSIDAINLISFKKVSQQQQLLNYIKNTVEPIRKSASPGTYYDESTYSSFVPEALFDERIPSKFLGKFLLNRGVNINSFLEIFGPLLAKILELLVPLGMVFILFKRYSVIKKITLEYYFLAFYYLVFIGLNIVLPVLSTQYGVYRALQQSLFIVAMIMVAGSYMIGWVIGVCIKFIELKIFKKFDKFNYDYVFTYLLTIIFLLQCTVFIPQLFGGNVAVLHLNNTGRYYDNYLIQTTEVYGVEWLTKVATLEPDALNGVKISVQTDRYSGFKFASITNLEAYNDIFPGLVRVNSYVFLPSSIVKKQRATLRYSGDQVTYKYPQYFFNNTKSLIYNNGHVNVYR